MWLRSNNCNWDEKVCIFASMKNRKELLKWAIENGALLSTDVYDILVDKNEWEMLKWAYENGCRISKAVYMEIIMNGNQEIKEWFQKNYDNVRLIIRKKRRI